MSKSILAETRARRRKAAEAGVEDLAAPPYDGEGEAPVDEAEAAALAVKEFNPLAKVKGTVEEEVIPVPDDAPDEPLDDEEAAILAEADPEDDDDVDEEPESPDDGMIEPEELARGSEMVREAEKNVTLLKDVDVHSVSLMHEASPEHGVHPIVEVSGEGYNRSGDGPADWREVPITHDPPEMVRPFVHDEIKTTPLVPNGSMAAVECTLCGRTGTAGAHYVETSCTFTPGCQGILQDVTAATVTLPFSVPDPLPRAAVVVEEAKALSRLQRIVRHVLHHREVAESPYEEVVHKYEDVEMAKEAADPGIDPVDAALWLAAGVVLPVWVGYALQATTWYETPLLLLLAVWSATQAASVWVRGDIARHCRELWISWRWDRAGSRIRRRAEKRAEKKWMR